MNSLERVRTAARRGDVGQVPVGPYIASWTARWSGIPLSSYCTDGQAMARAQLLAWEKLGQDIIFPDSDNYYLAEGFGCKTKINQDEIPTLVQPAISEFDQASRQLRGVGGTSSAPAARCPRTRRLKIFRP
jgi:uroporphyrinogen decarboxylase